MNIPRRIALLQIIILCYDRCVAPETCIRPALVDAGMAPIDRLGRFARETPSPNGTTLTAGVSVPAHAGRTYFNEAQTVHCQHCDDLHLLPVLLRQSRPISLWL